MISYSPNSMGPMNGWFEKYDIPYTWHHFTWEGEERKIKRYDSYVGGRIDIYGDEPWQELGCPIMTAEDWNELHYFCDEFKSEKQLNESEFFTEFEKWLGREMNLGPGEKRSDYIMENKDGRGCKIQTNYLGGRMKRVTKWGRGFNLQLTKNKNIEIEWDDDRNWFWLEAGINTGDHWGFEFYISILKVSFAFKFYDGRHRDE